MNSIDERPNVAFNVPLNLVNSVQCDSESITRLRFDKSARCEPAPSYRQRYIQGVITSYIYCLFHCVYSLSKLIFHKMGFPPIICTDKQQINKLEQVNYIMQIEEQSIKGDRYCVPDQWQSSSLWCQTKSIKMSYKANGNLIRNTFLFGLLLIANIQFTTARKDGLSNCKFPARWEGSWFQSGIHHPVHIKGPSLSFRGNCTASDGDKFLVVDEKGCHRCLVIYEKHKNVLQYKESECAEIMFADESNPAPMPLHQMATILKSDLRGSHPNSNGHSDSYLSDESSNDCFCKERREGLQTLCEQIPGDALLYSLFKQDAEPVKCPLHGPFTFTYNRGHGECKNPVSNIESCTEESRLLFSFQACPDVSGTESTIEELTCLATWKDGNSKFLVGLVSHHHAVSNEERYRCFVYERLGGIGGSHKDTEVKLAQSGDATCNGLDSAEVGSRIMTLKRAPPTERCEFPSWLKGPKHWHTLNGNYNYGFHQNDGSFHISKASGVLETRALCEQINKQTSIEMQSVVHFTAGCNSGYMCVQFYKRDTHIAEIQLGKPASRLEDACDINYFDSSNYSYVTLIAGNLETQNCPIEGSYVLKGKIGPPHIFARLKRNHNNRYHTHLHRKHETEVRIHDTHAKLKTYHDTESTVRSKRQLSDCQINKDINRRLLVGCNDPTVLEIQPKCADDKDEVYSCHGTWSDNQTTFIIAKHPATGQSVCVTYRQVENSLAYLAVGDSCIRGPFNAIQHSLLANITTIGKCGDPNVSNTLSRHPLVAILWPIIILMLAYR